jgi:hypothetical protein
MAVNTIIIALILIVITLHRYLSAFWEQGMLPYSFGLLIFTYFFYITYAISFIWMFGAVAGIVISLLCLFQIVYSSALWVFSLPWLVKMNNSNPLYSIPEVDIWVYGGYSILVMSVLALTVLNFFIPPYKSMWAVIGQNTQTKAFVFLGILFVGNITRVFVLSKLLKK